MNPLFVKRARVEGGAALDGGARMARGWLGWVGCAVCVAALLVGCGDDGGGGGGAQNNAGNNANNPDNNVNNPDNNVNNPNSDPNNVNNPDNNVNNPDNNANNPDNNVNNPDNNANNPPACDPPCALDEACVDGVCMGEGPLDGDEDGVVDVDDNCPELANADQADGDGDGLGDACDACPTVADPGNDPARCEYAQELEPNDDAIAGEQGWSLPLRVEGVVGEPIDGVADTDFYSVTVEAGKAVRVSLELDDPSFFGALIAFGYDFENQNFFRVLTGFDFGRSNAREMFLARPGRYTFLVSDLRNLVDNPDPSGGPNFQYRLSVEEFELAPEPTGSLPFNTSVTFDELLHVWRFPASAQPFVSARAAGQSFDQNALLLPTITIYDPVSKVVLAETGLDLIDQNTQTVEVRALTPGRGELWFIFDVLQGFGPNATTLSLTPGEAGQELEPNDTDDQAAPLQAPGRVEGRIDTPRAEGGRLIADADYYVFYAEEGQQLTLWVDPATPNNDFDAALDLGWIGEFGFLQTQYLVRDQGEGARSARLDFWAPQDGLYYALIRDQANFSVGPDEDPVGGADHAYIFRVEAAEFEVGEAQALPATVEGSLPGFGQQAFVRLEVPGGSVVEVAVEGGGLSGLLQVFDAQSAEFLGGGDGSVQFSSADAREVVVQVGDYLGRGGEGTEFVLTASARELEGVGALPFLTEGTLSAPNESDLYVLDLPANQLVDVRVEYVGSPITLLELAVLSPDDLNNPLANTYSRSLLLQSPQPTRLILRVRDWSGGGSPEHGYRMAVREVQAQEVSVPASATGTLSEPLQADYRGFTYEAGRRLLVDVEAVGGFSPTTALYAVTGQGAQILRSSSERQFLYASPQSSRLLLAVYESQNQSSPDYDYALSVSDFEPGLSPLPLRASGQIEPLRKAYWEVEAETGDLLQVYVQRTGEAPMLQPRITLYDGAGVGYLAQAYNQNLLQYQVNQPGTFIIELSDIAGGGGPDYGYELFVERALTVPLIVPDTQQGALEEGAPLDVYELVAPAGLTARVHVEAEGWEPVVRWSLVGGFENATFDQGDFLFVAPREGRYLFTVWDREGRSGDSFTYTFELFDFEIPAENVRTELEPNDNAEQAEPLVWDVAEVTGDLLGAGDAVVDQDWFALELGEGDVVMALTDYGPSDEFVDTTLRLVGPAPSDANLAYDDDAGVDNFSNLGAVVAPSSGTYHLVVSAFGAGAGSYALRLYVARQP
jgi:hypothetical protein